MIVTSTWSVFLALQSRVGGRRGVATVIMTVALLLVLLIPLGLALGVLIGNIDTIIAKANSLQTSRGTTSSRVGESDSTARPAVVGRMAAAV